MGDALTILVSGALAMGYFVAGLFFLRFWRDTRDRLFGSFAAAFFILALQRAAISLPIDPTTDQVFLYVLRLLAFLLILWAIIDKNRGAG